MADLLSDLLVVVDDDIVGSSFMVTADGPVELTSMATALFSSFITLSTTSLNGALVAPASGRTQWI